MGVKGVPARAMRQARQNTAKENVDSNFKLIKKIGMKSNSNKLPKLKTKGC